MPLKSTRVKNKRSAKENIFITPTSKVLVTTNFADCRPRRICRLPSKFEDHSTSPSKYIPLRPIQASTPKTQSKGSSVPNNNTELTVKSKNKADTNNNAKDSTLGKHKCMKSPSKDLNKKVSKGRLIEKEYSFKMFENNKKPSKRDASNLDIYEFTYDPSEEPPPQKKKRKRTVRKKQEKQQPVFTNNYNKNVAKSLAALKNALSVKNLEGKTQPERSKVKSKNCVNIVKHNELNTKNKIQDSTKKMEHQITGNEQNVTQKNYNSFRVEDIIVNEEPVCHVEKEINYSPVNSPYNIRLPSESRDHFENIQKDNDPLNLQDDISFFDDNPAASSSMNMSTRNPMATPWRVEFGQLPIKWQANTYVKPNMTPAFESSFLLLGDKKKHVYTNLVHEENEQLPEIFDNDSAPKLQQTSIISFIKEVAEKNAKKKLQSTPVKRTTVFEDIQNISHNLDITPQKQITSRSARKSVTPIKNKSSGDITSSTDNMSVSDKENSVEKQKKDKEITYFGFDETEVIDQENIIPNNKLDKQRRRALRPRSRAILKELNQKHPPVNPLSLTANRNTNEKRNLKNILKDLKDKDAPSLPGKDNQLTNSETINEVNNADVNVSNFTQEDSQSVHLFEDLEVIHHVKPPRKSYVKQKRVAFRQNSVTSDSQDSDIGEKDESNAVVDDLHDLTFQVQSMQPKKAKGKKKSKKLLSKKEEKEVEAWAAGFNSMCEDVDDFDLVIE